MTLDRMLVQTVKGHFYLFLDLILTKGAKKCIILRQHRTILIELIRRQIFCQTNQNDAGEMYFRQGVLVQCDGKDASSCVIKALAANCAVLP